MPQPNASEVQARLRARYGNKAGSTRTGGGKNAMRRKKFRQKKSSNEFEKRLQANLKKLSCNTIPGIEEVNLFKSDGTVIHFISPKVDAEVSSNTFIVSGSYTHNKIEELLPDILPQIGSDHLTQLKDYAEKFEALKPQSNTSNNNNNNNQNNQNNNDDDDVDVDVPQLIDEELNFEQVAQSDQKAATATATVAVPAADATVPVPVPVPAAAATDVDKDKDKVKADDDKDKEPQNNNNNNNDEPAKVVINDNKKDDKPAAAAVAVAVDDKPVDDKPAAVAVAVDDKPVDDKPVIAKPVDDDNDDNNTTSTDTQTNVKPSS